MRDKTMMQRKSSSAVASHLFIWLVSLSGLVVAADSLTRLFSGGDASWLLLAGLTAVVSSFGFKLAGPGGRLGNLSSSAGDCFMVAGFLLYGPAAAVVVAAVEAVVNNLGFRIKSADKWLFNIGQHALAAFFAAQFFYFAGGLTSPVDWSAIAHPWTLLVFGLSLAGYLILNSGLIVTAMALRGGQPLGALWKRCTLGVGPATLLNGTAGLVIVSCSQSIYLAASVIVLGLSLYYVGQISLIFRGERRPRKAAGDLYVACIVAGGLAAAFFSFFAAALDPSPAWLVLMGLTAAASLRPSYLPRLGLQEGGMVVTFSTVFVFLGLLVAGPAAAVTLSVTEAAVSAWKSGDAIRDPKKVLFNLFQLPLAMFLAGNLFYWICPQPFAQSPAFPAALAFCSLLYLAMNLTAVSAAVYLTTGRPSRLGDSLCMSSAGLRQVAEAALATVAFVSWLTLSPWALLGIGLASGLLLASFNLNLSRFRIAQESL